MVSGVTSPIPSPDEINAMSDTDYKVYENRLRRMAQRQGLRLAKSRRRDPRAWDYNTYMLVDVATTGIVASGSQSGYGLGLDDIEKELTK